jgi:hypothetical protein
LKIPKGYSEGVNLRTGKTNTLRKITETAFFLTGTKSIPLAHTIHVRSLSWIGTGTSISGGVKYNDAVVHHDTVQMRIERNCNLLVINNNIGYLEKDIVETKEIVKTKDIIILY